jgi:putative endonuclease
MSGRFLVPRNDSTLAAKIAFVAGDPEIARRPHNALPMRERSYYIYILAHRAGTLYIGVTNDLERRVAEHKAKLTPGFTARYNTTRLVYYEDTDDVWSALEREKQLKGWRRSKKVELIQSMNPHWIDLARDFGR